MFAYLGVGSVSESGAHKRGFLRGFSVEGTKAKRDRHLRFPRRKAVARAFNCGMCLSLENINGKTFAI